MNKPKYYIAPGQTIDCTIVQCLAQANKNYTKGGFPKYIKEIESIFELAPIQSLTKEQKIWLCGFIEGEGSFNVSIKKQKNAKFGVLIDLEFSLTQHINGVKTLHGIMGALRSGRLRYKSGSNATLVLVIDNRENIEKVIHFVESHGCSFSSVVKQERLQIFKQILKLFKDDQHKRLEGITTKILPLWDQMRMQKNKVNQSFANLEEAINYVTNFKQ